MDERYRPLTFFAAGAAAVGISSLLYSTLTRPAHPAPIPRPFRSPADTSSPANDSSSTSASSLPYPLDALPGGRSVETPYCTLRVYEFGPAASVRKVLLVHGISASSFALHEVARQLVQLGARVMVVDLYGRGWSGGPADLPYDGRLYASLLLTALAASRLPWSGAGPSGYGAFTLVGHSLGGGIAADFASYFPDLVEDLVLIAPGGLNRRARIPLASRLMYNGWVPEWWLARRLHAWLANYPITALSADDAGAGAAVQEAADRRADNAATLRRQQRAQDTVVWQLASNEGFMPAFISSMKHAPIFDQQPRWGLIGRRLSVRPPAAARARASARADEPEAAGMEDKEEERTNPGFRAGRVLLFLGAHDTIIPPDYTATAAVAALGGDPSRVDAQVLDAGHDLPVTRPREIAEGIWRHLHP